MLMFISGINEAKAQLTYELKNDYGNVIANISWPPPDSSYVLNKIIVYFKPASINQFYLCNYWNNYNTSMDVNNKQNYIQTYGVGEFPINLDLLADTVLYNTLLSVGAIKMTSITKLSPCKDTLSITLYGDTITTPNFWNCFEITLDSSKAISAIQTLMLMYCPSKIRYSQPLYLHVQDVEPNDAGYQSNTQTNLKNSLLGEDFVGAWNIVKGRREVKVAVVDDGINYIHQDFGQHIGIDYPIIKGYLFDDAHPQGIESSDIYQESTHGTFCAGMIGALTNNTEGVSSIAGKWNSNSTSNGISLYGIKEEFSNRYKAITFAGESVSNGGIGANIISYSAGELKNGVHDYAISECIDYIYKLGTLFVNSKGNLGIGDYREPSDLSYNKVLAVGNYAPFKPDDGTENYIPSRSVKAGSNFDGGLDIMAQGDNLNPDKIRNATTWAYLDEDDLPVYSYRDFGGTSAACPQVAGLAALVVSEMYNLTDKMFYDEDLDQDIKVLNPEDIQGLINISAMDCDFTYFNKLNQIVSDSVGYDKFTGYGVIKAGKTIENMLLTKGNMLIHKSIKGGEIYESSLPIMPYIIKEPTSKNPLVPANAYKAIRHDVRRTVDLRTIFPNTFYELVNANNPLKWFEARSWGRGGYKTLGWSAEEPINSSMNIVDDNRYEHPTGYCRVIGEADANQIHFNTKNIRDISYQKEHITLQTYCFQLYDRITDEFIKWVPCEPKDVVYQFTTWGQNNISSVEEVVIFNASQLKYNVNTKEISLEINDEYIKVDATLQLFDILGKNIFQEKIENFGNKYSKVFSDLSYGIYLVNLTINNKHYKGKINVE